MTRLFTKKNTPVILVLTLILLVTTISMSNALDSSTPVVKSNNPIDGSISDSSDVTITFTVYDPDLIDNSNYSIKINGSLITSKLNYRGHFETDSCSGQQYWVADGYDEATVSGYAPGLEDGPHTVEIQAADRLGNIVNNTWNFNVAEKPGFSAMTPAGGSTAVVNNSISVKITDNTAISQDSISLAVDNIVADSSNISFNSSTGLLTYNVPAPGLVNGSHTVSVTARDSSGNEASTSWSFNLQTQGDPLSFPQSGATFNTGTPELTVIARSNARLDSAGATMSVDGNPVDATFNYKGHWVEQFELDPYWQIDSYYEGTVSCTPVLKDGTHTLSATTLDVLGNKTTGNWNFAVNSIPAFSTPTPGNGQNTTDNSGFSVKLTDNDGIVPASVAFYLDGVIMPGTFDSVTGIAAFTSEGGLSNGTHSAKVIAQDTTGNIASFSWSFTVQTTGPEIIFSGNGQTFESCKPQLLATVKSNVRINDTSTSVTIDGQPINAEFAYKGHWEPQFELDPYWAVDSYNEGNINYIPEMLNDGIHEIVITAKDILGNQSTQNFNFSISQKPVFSGIEPVTGTTVGTRTPMIKATAADPNGTINKDSVKLMLDGSPVVSVITDSDSGINVSYNANSLSIDSYHEVNLAVTDNSGNQASQAWKFYVDTKGDMQPTAEDCGSCHTLNQYKKYVHSQGPLGIGVNNSSPTHFYGNACDHCHNSYNDKTCGYCHGANIFPPWEDDTWVRPDSNPALSTGQDCLYCHSTNNGGWVPSQYPANHFYWVKYMINIGMEPIKPLYPDLSYTVRHDILPTHQTNKGACNDCHSIYLTREHNKKNKNGVQITCASCHLSDDTKVRQAITDKNRDCSACHTGADHESLHNDSLDLQCQTCHKGTLTGEHLNNPNTTVDKNYTCETCHSNTSREVSRTISADNTNCGGCHRTETHNLLFEDSIPADIPLYPDFSWSAPLEADIFSGESNTPEEYTDGQVVFSNRRLNVSVNEVWNYYSQELTVNGWTLKSGTPAPGASWFAAEFIKGSKSLISKCYKTENSDGTGETIDTGYRLEIWYKSL